MTTLQDSLVDLERNAMYDFRRRALMRTILPSIIGEDVIDVGCGMGFMSEALAKRGHKTTAVDVEQIYVSYTHQRMLTYKSSVGSILYKDTQLPFHDACFDSLISLDVIEHVEDHNRLVREFARVLRPYGRVILSVPALPMLYGKRDINHGHFRRYNKHSLVTTLQQANLQIEQIAYWNCLGVLPYLISERLLQREIPDSIRKGRQSFARAVTARLLEKWLSIEGEINSLPCGLSLLVVARKPV